MERKPYGCQVKLEKLWILVLMPTVFLALLVGAATSPATQDECYPTTKIECGRQGWVHYTEAKCVEDERCCWNRKNIPNCFYKATAQLPGPQCLVDPAVRVDCGDPSTKPQQCLDRECCWNVTLHGKWCYYPRISTSTTKIPLQPTSAMTDDPGVKSISTCKCYIEADPIVRKFDGSQEAIRGVELVVLYHNVQHQINVSVTLAKGSGKWARSTVLGSAIVSKGSPENKIVFTRDGLKTFGDAPGYDDLSANHALKVKLRDDEVTGSFEFNDLFAKFSLEIPYESYYNDGGVCGVCPPAQD